MKLKEKDLIAELKAGKSVRQIAKDNYMNYQSLAKRVRRNGLDEYKTFTQKKDIDMEKAAELYQKGYSVHTIGEMLNVAGKTVWKRLKKTDEVDMRGPGAVSQMNHEFFSVIDTQEKAYWLGVIAGDGSIGNYNGQKQIHIGVQLKDGMWIKKFRDAIGSDANISNMVNNWNGVAQILLTSERMYDDLLEKGITPDKSHDISGISYPDELSVHFWRGVFDADGSVYLGKKNSNFVNVLTTASEKFADEATQFVDSFGLESKRYDNEGTITQRLFGENAAKYLDILYEDANVFLRRKHEKYMELKGMKKVVREGVHQISMAEAQAFFAKYHYLKTCKPSTTYGMFDGGELIAAAAISSCSSPSVAKTVFGEGKSRRVRELHRFCIMPEKNEKNLASQFLAKVRKEYQENYPKVWAIVSFADSAQGHEGTIYKAVGALEVDRENRSQLIVCTPDGQRLTGRDEVILKTVEESGFDISDCSLEKSDGKSKFVLLLGSAQDKRDRKKLLKIDI